MPLSQTQLDFLQQAAQAAVPGDQIQDVPLELSVPQWAEESGWGKHQPGNNPFGLKARHDEPLTQLLPTEEYFTEEQAAAFVALGGGRTAKISPLAGNASDGRELYDCLDLFAAFPDLTAAFSRHAELIATSAPYAVAFSAWQASQRDMSAIEALIRGVAARYSTSPTYADTLLAIGRMPEVVAAIQEARGT